MNEVDFLLRKPFVNLRIEEKVEIKKLGPHQPTDFVLEQYFQSRKRTFSCTWYEKHEWLTVSLEKKRFFCFYCLLFLDSKDAERTWSRVGYSDLNHFHRSAKKHENSENHLTSAIRYKTFVTVKIGADLHHSDGLSIKRHNERVAKNRHVLNKIIDGIKFCGTHGIPLRGHDEMESFSNGGVFLDLLSFVSSLDTQLQDHLDNASIAYTSTTIQNEILDCVEFVYLDQIKKEIGEAEFVAVEVDETTDISSKSQFAIIIRYIKDTLPVERFLKCVAVPDRTAKGLAGVLQEELKYFEIKHKLVALAYDGASGISRQSDGVQTIIQQDFPHAHYVYSYAHQFDLVLRRLVDRLPEARLFFTNLDGFSAFFSESSKRSDALKAACSTNALTTPRLDFKSRLIDTVYIHRQELVVCFEDIMDEPSTWDDSTIREACGFRMVLENEQFQYFLQFFFKIFSHVEVFFTAFRDSLINGNGADAVKCVEDFVKTIQIIKESLEDGPVIGDRKRRLAGSSDNAKATAVEVCDVLMTQLSTKLLGNTFTSSFSIVNPAKFQLFRSQFPETHIQTILGKYPFLVHEKLKSELKVIYQNDSFSHDKCPSITKLFSRICSTGLHTSFTETTKLMKLILTVPVASAEPERCFSTLKRVKNFLRSSNSKNQDLHNSLMILSIHKTEISERNAVPDLNERVIQKFAEAKHRRVDFLYRK